MRIRALLLSIALLPHPAGAAEPSVLDLLTFQTGDADTWERLHRTSDSLPLSLDELERLAAAGIGDATLRELMRTRRVLATADADTLVRMKKAGASDDALAALSAYAFPPNDHLTLRVDLDVASPDSVREAPFLYLEVWHADLGRAEAFLHADLRGLQRRGLGVDVVRDRSDPLLHETVRSVHFTGDVPSRHAGKLQVRVLVSKRAGLRTLAGLDPVEAARVRTFDVDYPGVSLDHRCALGLTLRRDRVLKDTYTLADSHLQCWWD